MTDTVDKSIDEENDMSKPGDFGTDIYCELVSNGCDAAKSKTISDEAELYAAAYELYQEKGIKPVMDILMGVER